MRVRLSFEDQLVLSKSQKKQGLKRSWVVLDPKCHRTVSEFSDHLLHTFCLFEACPHGISLSVGLLLLYPNINGYMHCLGSFLWKVLIFDFRWTVSFCRRLSRAAY